MDRNIGGRNRGYFYRSGRAWYAQVEGRMIWLVDSDAVAARELYDPATIR